MKRPILIYVVAGWCFIAFELQASYLSRSISSLVADGQPSEDLRRTLSAAIAVLVIWHVVRLVQLKSFNRWLSVAFFGWWTVAMIWNGSILLPKLEHPVRQALGVLTLAVFNIGSVYYLSRRSFRDFATQFVAEREKAKHSRNMQEASARSIRKGL